jgi:hypothetical protein
MSIIITITFIIIIIIIIIIIARHSVEPQPAQRLSVGISRPFRRYYPR